MSYGTSSSQCAYEHDNEEGDQSCRNPNYQQSNEYDRDKCGTRHISEPKRSQYRGAAQWHQTNAD